MKCVDNQRITLKAARAIKGYTQEEAAKLIGISVFTLINYEAGRSYPDVPIIKKIEDTYDIPYHKLNFLI